MQVALHLYSHISSFVLKIRSNRATFIALIVLAWDVVLLIPLIGRFMLQKPELGRYYGIADEWYVPFFRIMFEYLVMATDPLTGMYVLRCWINYHDERIFLECVFVSRNKISFCMSAIYSSCDIIVCIFMRVICRDIRHVHKMQNKTRARNFVESESESRQRSLARAVACHCYGSIT
jgi:hypothetical protein